MGLKLILPLTIRSIQVYVERIEVEGGFLDGLQLTLKPGLNVLIGARGTGKTSLIELIRFCLDASAFTEQARLRANQHALAVLGSGRVTVYLGREGDQVTVSRTGSDQRPRSTGLYSAITVLAQNEIEVVGAALEGRLRLIDTFIPEADVSLDAEQVLSELSSQTAEIQGLLNEIASFEAQQAELGSVPEVLAAAVDEQQRLLTSVQSSQREQDLLMELQAKSAQLTVRLDVFARTKKAMATAGARIRTTESAIPVVEQWPAAAGGPDQLGDIRGRVDDAGRSLTSLLDSLKEAVRQLAELEESTSRDRVSNDENARPLRQKLDQLKAGAGALAQKVEGLREKEGQLSALTEAVQEARGRLKKLMEGRRRTFDELEELRAKRLAKRAEVVEWLNRELRPAIKASLIGSGQTQHYIMSIAETLQGSGLHYNSLAPLIAAKLSPLELVEALEAGDAAGIASSTGIATDRSGAICSYLAGKDISKLIMSRVDDSVTLSLLDGKEFKESTELSIGQRCTVVLPILLSRHQDVLVVDQPEDHLDNAFVTNTLVPSLLRREPGEQLLFSSHNANIPVLGEADNVVLMESDGRRGFVRHSGHIDDPKTVDAVTDVMEGGREAFQRRAEFYQRVYGLRNG